MNNFSPRAQQVMAYARKEADRFTRKCVDTEHLLLGLVKLGQGTAVNVLQKMGIDLEVDIERTHNEIRKELDPGFAPGTEP